MEIRNQFYLDTSYCVTKRKTFNRHCLYDTFAEYTDLNANEVKAELISELITNHDWYNKAGAACLGMRGIKYDTWLKKLRVAHGWPDKLALYALCIIFRRNALVMNSGRLWTTLKNTSNLSIRILKEMCETVLLYLGNNLYGIVRRLPYSLDRATPVSFGDMHQMRPLFQDDNVRRLYMLININSDFERAIRDDEIEELQEQKPELLPETQRTDVFHLDYVPKPEIKKEPLDSYYQEVIGSIITMLENITCEIKEELLDNQVQALLQHHSEGCELSHYVHQCDMRSGLHIEDVRTLLQVELPPVTEEEKTEVETTVVAEPVQEPKEQLTKRWSRIMNEPIDMVPNTSSDTLTVTSTTVLPVVTPNTIQRAKSISQATHTMTSPPELPKQSVTAVPVSTDLESMLSKVSSAIPMVRSLTTHSHITPALTVGTVTSTSADTPISCTRSVVPVVTSMVTPMLLTLDIKVELPLVTNAIIHRNKNAEPLSVVTMSTLSSTDTPTLITDVALPVVTTANIQWNINAAPLPVVTMSTIPSTGITTTMVLPTTMSESTDDNTVPVVTSSTTTTTHERQTILAMTDPSIDTQHGIK